SGLHLLHDVASVDFYCGLAGSNFRGNLLIEPSGNHQSHYLPLSRSQSVIALLQIVDLALLFLRGVVPLERLLNCIQQILIPERFCQKFHGTRLQCPHRHRDVTVRRDEDDGDLHSALSQSTLKIESAHPRQSYVENQAAGTMSVFRAEKLLTSRK